MLPFGEPMTSSQKPSWASITTSGGLAGYDTTPGLELGLAWGKAHLIDANVGAVRGLAGDTADVRCATGGQTRSAPLGHLEGRGQCKGSESRVEVRLNSGLYRGEQKNSLLGKMMMTLLLNCAALYSLQDKQSVFSEPHAAPGKQPGQWLLLSWHSPRAQT